MKFWHAVITMSGSRLSYGVKFAKEILKRLEIEDIWGDDMETFRLIFKPEHKDYVGPQRVPDFLNENEINRLRTRFQEFSLDDALVGKNQNITHIRKSKVKFLKKNYEFFPLYYKIFKEVVKFDNQYFKFSLTEDY
jgi:hypothetical protein